MNNMQNNNQYIMPAAIVFSGLIVAGALVYSNVNPKKEAYLPKQGEPAADIQPSNVENIKPVTSSDHVLGNPAAPVKIIEFSDLECPFCKKFHQTMQTIVEEYGKTGQAAWIYRHFPIDSRHPVKARKAAEATECANELGGNEKFWAYIERYFEITPSNNNIDLAQLPQIAEDVGLDKSKFESCLASGKYAKHIEDDYQDGVAAGVEGTPYSILIAPNNQKFVINGALSYATVKQLIDSSLKLK